MKLLNLNTLKFAARLLIVLAWVVSPNAVWSFSDKPIHHQLKIELEPLTRFARIEDTVQFKTSSENCGSFYLHAGLSLEGIPQGWQVKPSVRPGLNEIELVKSGSAACPETLTLKYSGVLHDPTLDPEDSDELSDEDSLPVKAKGKSHQVEVRSKSSRSGIEVPRSELEVQPK